MATFNKYSSWGRTRSPKNLAGDPGTAITLHGHVNALKADTSGYKLKGNATENQRYLHVLVCDANSSGTPGAITVYGYCHAFEHWFEIGASTLDTPISAASANTAPTAATITAGNYGRADDSQVPSDREYRRYDICGIDRIAFVGDDDESNVYAACSTF